MSTNRMIFNDAYSLMRKLQVMVKVFMLMFKHSSAFLAITTFSFFTKKEKKTRRLKENCCSFVLKQIVNWKREID